MTLENLRALQRLLDEAFRVPGTRMRVGLDPIIGLVPWAGDVLTALMACSIVVHAHRLRVPRVVQLRMLINVLVDIAVGAVPVVGDVADVFWKANTKNMALLEQHAPRLRSSNAGTSAGGQAASTATWGDWLFVTGVVSAILAFALLPLMVLYWIVNALVGRVP